MFNLAKIQTFFNEFTLMILVSLSAFTLWRHFGLATVAGALLVWSIIQVLIIEAKKQQQVSGVESRADLNQEQIKNGGSFEG